MKKFVFCSYYYDVNSPSRMDGYLIGSAAATGEITNPLRVAIAPGGSLPRSKGKRCFVNNRVIVTRLNNELGHFLLALIHNLDKANWVVQTFSKIYYSFIWKFVKVINNDIVEG